MNDKILVIREFKGSCIGESNYHNSKLSFQLFQEPLVYVDGNIYDYNIHFVFGIKNVSSETVNIEVCSDDHSSCIRTPFQSNLYVSENPDVEFCNILPILQTDGYKWHSFRLTLQAGQTKYVANTLWRPYAYLSSRFDFLAKQCNFKKIIFGKSIEGRDLIAYQSPLNNYDSTERPTLLVTSGMHPMEPDTLGTEALLEKFSNTQDLLHHANVIIVPIANPDGFVHGYNGCNAAGINILWDFQFKNPQQCPEATALWDLIKRTRPWVYIDFHCYTFHKHLKVPGPYFKPSCFYYGKAAQDCARQIEQTLNQIPGTRPLYPYAPSSSFYRLTKEMNLVTIAKYHLHLDLGKQGCKDLAWDIFNRVCNALNQGTWNRDDILLKPYGKQRRRLGDTMYQWKFLLRRQGSFAKRKFINFTK